MSQTAATAHRQDVGGSVLEARKVSKRFGGLQVLTDCSLQVREKTIVAIVGPNGAGKTTLFNVLTGQVAPSSGHVLLDDQDITGKAPERIARLGAVKTFQVPREFASLTVLENLMVSGSAHSDASLWRAIFRRPGLHGAEGDRVDRAAETLKFLNLSHMVFEPAMSLSTGQKKLLDLGRAMMLDPRLLLLDEPLAGVSPKLADDIASRLEELRQSGVSIALIEHRLDFVSDICQEMYVLAEGQILVHGDPETCLSDQRVVDAFLGVEVS